VTTQEGEKEIADIQEGDYVLAWNEETNEVGYYEVTDTFSHIDPVLTELIINGEWIETTPEHPFYTLEEGWIPADELEMGMHVRQADGNYEMVWFKWNVEKDQEMYNFTVDTAHTYFVGEGQWLVHNECDRAELASNLKSVVNDKYQAHHLIPCQFCDLDVIKKAVSDGFNFNGAENGILLPDNINLSIKDNLPWHNGSHPIYNAYVGEEILHLDNLSRINRWSPNQAHNQVLKLTNKLKNTINNMGGGIRLK
jgi:hypothetical protein